MLPSPSPDLVEMGPDLRVLAEPMAPATNRVIAAYMSPSYLATLPQGTGKGTETYALVEVLRRVEFIDVDEKNFAIVVNSTDAQMGGSELDEATKKSQQFIADRIKELGLSSDAKLDKIVPLRKMFSKQDASGYALMLPFTAGGKSANMIGGMLVLRVHKRVVFAYLYQIYKDESSVEWITKTSEAWADAILKANAE